MGEINPVNQSESQRATGVTGVGKEVNVQVGESKKDKGGRVG